MKLKKLLTSAVSILLASTMLVGCGESGSTSNDNKSSGNAGGTSSKPEQSAANKDVSLTVWGSQEDQEMLKKMCEDFAKANPDKNYTFTYGVVSEADAQKEVTKDISAAADVFAFASDQTGILVDAGALYRVTKNKDQIIANNTEASIGAASRDGELYAYPYVADTYFLYYDKSKLSEEDVKSVEAIIDKDLGDGVKNLVMDLANGWYICSFFFGAGCKLFGDDGTDPTKCDFNNESGKKVGEYLIDLAGKETKFGGKAKDPDVKSGFTEGTIAAAISGAWNAKDIKDALGENFAATKLPTFKLDGKDTQLGGMANFKLIGVNAETKAPLDAMALAEWLTNEDNQKVRFEERSFAPTNKNLASNTELLNSNIAVGALTQQAQYATVQTSISQVSNYWTPAQSFGEEVMNGGCTKDNLQERLDAMVEGILATLS